MNELLLIVKEAINNHPSKRAELIEIFEGARAEIEDGGSIDHEVELAVGAVNELISDK
jgi:hypothetical protein